MKKIITLILMLSCISGCSANMDMSETNNINTVSDTTFNDTEIPVTITPVNTTIPNEVPSSQIANEITDTQTTSDVILQIEDEENSAIITSKTETAKTTTKAETAKTTTKAETAKITTKAETAKTTTKAEITMSTEKQNDERVILYSDELTKKEYFLVSMTPQEIYWNEIDNYQLSIGQSINAFIPSVFFELISDADEVLIHFNSEKVESIKINSDIIISNGIKYQQYWYLDYLCPIKDDYMYFYDYTEEIKNAFSRIYDGVYLEEANDYYPENPFRSPMSTADLDLYFKTIKNDHDELIKTIKDNPDTDFDIAGFWGYQTGAKFRAKINEIL